MKDYQEAAEVLGTRASRKIDNHTYLQRRSENAIAVKLHATDILLFVEGKGVRYDSGGWKTPTTKDRMNEFGPVRISQANGLWFVADGGEVRRVYADGMRYERGKIVGAGETRVVGKRILVERKRIKLFAKRFMDAFEAGNVPAPGGGDCWGCLMKGTDSEGREVHMLEGGGANDPSHHIRDHVRENYYVPSLLANALKAGGASQTMCWWVGGWWATEGEAVTPEMKEGAKKWGERARVEKALRRYVLLKLGHVR